jgi:hypothetical protein
LIVARSATSPSIIPVLITKESLLSDANLSANLQAAI